MAPRKNGKNGQPLAGSPSPLQIPWGDLQALKVDVEPIKAATERLQAQVDAGRMPGFVSCVLKEGQLVHLQAYGSSDICGGAPMQADTLFRLYSQTKPVTVVGALRLLERGALSLEDPVAKHIPSFANVVVGDKRQTPSRQMLIRDLVAHTSGVGFGPGFGYEPENDYERAYVDVVARVDSGEIHSLAEWCDEIAKLPLRFHPGTDWGYGYSSDILGRVVEVVSGLPLDQFLKAEVLDPLGMSDTFFSVPTEKSQRLAALYKREPWDGSGKNVKFVTTDAGGSGIVSDSSKKVYDRTSDGIGGSAPSSSVFLKGGASKVIQGGGCVCSVAGGLVSSMRDYIRFGQMLLNHGELDGVRLLQPESVGLLVKDWLNEFSTERRKQPLWVWNTPGIGFSPLGQIGVDHPDATDRRTVGSALHTVHWGGAGGSGYLINWPHRVLVLTYTGCAYDTATQKAMWRAAFGALRRGGSKPSFGVPEPSEQARPETPAAGSKRPRGRSSAGGAKEVQSSKKETPVKRRRTSIASEKSAAGSTTKKKAR